MNETTSIFEDLCLTQRNTKVFMKFYTKCRIGLAFNACQSVGCNFMLHTWAHTCSLCQWNPSHHANKKKRSVGQIIYVPTDSLHRITLAYSGDPPMISILNKHLSMSNMQLHLMFIYSTYQVPVACFTFDMITPMTITGITAHTTTLQHLIIRVSNSELIMNINANRRSCTKSLIDIVCCMCWVMAQT